MDNIDLKRSKKHVPSFKMPFTLKSRLKGNLKYERKFYLLAISLIKAGMGSLKLLDWQSENPQPVFYVHGKMLEEVILERIKG